MNKCTLVLYCFCLLRDSECNLLVTAKFLVRCRDQHHDILNAFCIYVVIFLCSALVVNY